MKLPRLTFRPLRQAKRQVIYMAAEHVVPPAPHPNAAPNMIRPTEEAISWDPSAHLQLEAPTYLKMLRREKLPGGDTTDLIQFPVPVSYSSDGSFRTAAKALDQQATVPFNGLAFSAPFRLLSGEGVQALRSVIAKNEQHACALPSRAAKALRGLGYRSQFIRDFNNCPVIREHLSQMAGTPLGAHHMPMNNSQTNFGEIGANKPVDQWHIDSVPYVMVLLLSDATDMEGGQLQVANLGDPKAAIETIQTKGISRSQMDVVDYPGPGYCIFMQGSKIAHSVTAVTKANEPRLTVVNSFQSLNPFSPDRTSYITFKDLDGNAAPFEFARHVSWRVSGQLDYLMKAKLFGDEREVAKILDGAAQELQRARDLVSGAIEDERPYKLIGDKPKAKL